jgi:hypothetical protein
MLGLVNTVDENSSISLISINGQFQKITIYLLCSSNIDDDFKIQALFGKSEKLDLEPIERLQTDHRSQTVVYRLERHVPINDDQYTNTSNENNNSSMNKYQLTMSTKTRNTSTHYDDSKQRTIHMNSPYQFLFDVHFHNHLLPSSQSMISTLESIETKNSQTWI